MKRRPSLLTPEFLEPYTRLKPSWGPLGEVVYLRTYSRWLPEKNRREHWYETVARVVDYSFSLYSGPATDDELRKEAQALYDTIFTMRGFPSGRTLWVGGSDYSYLPQAGASNFNCAFVDLQTKADFHDITFLLMSGCGVGTRVTRDNLEALDRNLPLDGKPRVVEVLPYHFLGFPSIEETRTVVDDRTGSATIFVGDSREGWSQAVQSFLEVYTDERVEKIEISLNAVRPLGSRLKTFGGYASGPEPLRAFFEDASRVLWEQSKWTDVMGLDLVNMIGRMVVAGGTRRSAEIVFGDSTSNEFIRAKDFTAGVVPEWRYQSNNTIVFESKPDRDTLLERFKAISVNGEPGLLNETAAKVRRPNFRGLNPCAEILMDSHGFCNLVTINLVAHTEKNGITSFFDHKLAARTLMLLTRHAMRITNVDIKGVNPRWDEVQKRDRLLGVSFTGLGTILDRNTDIDLGYLHNVVEKTARDYAYEMRIPIPLLSTTVKPEGTISNLPGVSSGIHNEFAPTYIRRVRISSTDGVAQALIMCGLEPQVDPYNHNTLVFEFPISTSAVKAASEYSAVEQLERYKLIQQEWCDHNASNTIYFSEGEIPKIVDWLQENWDEYVAVSFLRKDDNSYPLMPYERVMGKQFNELVKPDLSRLREFLDLYEESGASHTDDLEGCEAGNCPVR